MKFLRRLAGVVGDDAPPRPLPNNYWVQPGHLLAGEYPGSPDDDEMAERIARIVAAGIDSFIDLMRPLGLIEICRTGVASVARGKKGI